MNQRAVRMFKRLILLVVILMVAKVAFFSGDTETENDKLDKSSDKRSRPNILLILGDDIGIDMTSNMYPGLIEELTEQYGPKGLNHPNYKDIDGHPASTPALDSLSKSGIRFTQAWTQPFCSPTRTSLLTGLYSSRTGVLDYFGYLSQNHHSFVQDLKDKGGYSTAIFGKWHIAGLNEYPGMKPKEAGFDLFLGNLHGGIDTYHAYDYQIQDEDTPDDEWRTEKAPVRSLPGVKATTYAPVVKTADAIKWIKEREEKDPDKPWFVWFSFNLSHISAQQEPNPMVVPNEDTLDKISRKEMEECGGEFGSPNVGNCSSEALMRAMTNSMDTMIGILLDEVDKLDKNTYVIYLGDNGTWMFGPRREFIDNMYITKRGRSKGTAFESGVRVSMAIRGPGIEEGTKTDVPVHNVDLFSTILELAGLEVPETVPNKEGTKQIAVDAMSLTPILFKGAQELRDPNKGYMLAETINPVMRNLHQAAARNGRYKVICDHHAKAPNCSFYDLEVDPLEEYGAFAPFSCENFENGTWTPDDQQWHFCHLLNVIATESFLAEKN